MRLCTPLRLRLGLAAIVGLTCLPRAAVAHAYIITSEPTQNARVDAARFISLSFDEPITLDSRTPLIVRDSRGHVVPCIHGASLDPNDATRVVCTFAQPLRQGTYDVEWLVTSADTHVVHGTFAFGVGELPRAEAAAKHSIYDPAGMLATLARWLSLGGVALAFGALIFVIVVVPATSARDTRLDTARAAMRAACSKLAGIGTAVALGGAALGIIVQNSAASGNDAIAALPQIGHMAFATLWGTAWCVRVTALIAVDAARVRDPGLGLAACAVALLSISASGHAASSGITLESLALVATDFVHAAGASAWAGGMVALGASLAAARASVDDTLRASFMRETIVRYSSIAVVSVGMIVVTGVVASVVHLGALSALVETSYGRVILAKIVLLAPLLAIGFAHHRQGRERAVRSDIVTSLSGEAIIAFSVIGLSALLSGLAPPHLPQPQSETSRVSYTR